MKPMLEAKPITSTPDRLKMYTNEAIETDVKSIYFKCINRSRSGRRIQIPCFMVMQPGGAKIFISIVKYGWIEAWQKAVLTLKITGGGFEKINLQLPPEEDMFLVNKR